MKLLFVNACVREESRTLVLCRAYLKQLGENVAIKEVALAKQPLLPLNAERIQTRDADIAASRLDQPAYAWARDFAAADKIVVAAPYWDCSFPSILKIYTENICVNGLTFGYVDGQPAGLCHAGELVYITTAGGYIPEHSSLEMYWQELCAMLGIPKLTLIKAEGLDIEGNDAEAILQEAIRKL